MSIMGDGAFFGKAKEAKPPFAYMQVVQDPGELCTCRKGDTVLTAESTNRTCLFALPTKGSWIIENSRINKEVACTERMAITSVNIIAIPVTVTTSGNYLANCYFTWLSGPKINRAGAYYAPKYGSLIFKAMGQQMDSKLVINGTTVVSEADLEYDWAIPNEVTQIHISMESSGSGSGGRTYYTITVTTE